jgi:hypothetical protein
VLSRRSEAPGRTPPPARLSRCQLTITLHSGSLVAVLEPQPKPLATAHVAAELALPPPSCLCKRSAPTQLLPGVVVSGTDRLRSLRPPALELRLAGVCPSPASAALAGAAATATRAPRKRLAAHALPGRRVSGPPVRWKQTAPDLAQAGHATLCCWAENRNRPSGFDFFF